MKIIHRESVGSKRAAEYPPIGDQLDAIAKLANSLREAGTPMPEEVLKWLEQCQAVKRKYPKI